MGASVANGGSRQRERGKRLCFGRPARKLSSGMQLCITHGQKGRFSNYAPWETSSVAVVQALVKPLLKQKGFERSDDVIGSIEGGGDL